jgi:hypothetical protein
MSRMGQIRYIQELGRKSMLEADSLENLDVDGRVVMNFRVP